MKRIAESVLTVGMIFCGASIDGAAEKPESFAVYLAVFAVTMAAALVLAHGRHA